MPGSTGTSGFSSVFSSAPITAGTIGSYTAVAQPGDIKGPGPKGKVITITNNDSPAGFEEFIPGLVDGGEIEIDLIFKAAQAATVYGWFRQVRAFKIQYPDGTSTPPTTTGSTWLATGFITDFGPESPMENAIKVSTKFKVSGAPTFTAAT